MSRRLPVFKRLAPVVETTEPKPEPDEVEEEPQRPVTPARAERFRQYLMHVKTNNEAIFFNPNIFMRTEDPATADRVVPLGSGRGFHNEDITMYPSYIRSFFDPTFKIHRKIVPGIILPKVKNSCHLSTIEVMELLPHCYAKQQSANHEFCIDTSKLALKSPLSNVQVIDRSLKPILIVTCRPLYYTNVLVPGGPGIFMVHQKQDLQIIGPKMITDRCKYMSMHLTQYSSGLPAHSYNCRYIGPRPFTDQTKLFHTTGGTLNVSSTYGQVLTTRCNHIDVTETLGAITFNFTPNFALYSSTMMNSVTDLESRDVFVLNLELYNSPDRLENVLAVPFTVVQSSVALSKTRQAFDQGLLNDSFWEPTLPVPSVWPPMSKMSVAEIMSRVSPLVVPAHNYSHSDNAICVRTRVNAHYLECLARYSAISVAHHRVLYMEYQGTERFRTKDHHTCSLPKLPRLPQARPFPFGNRDVFNGKRVTKLPTIFG